MIIFNEYLLICIYYNDSQLLKFSAWQHRQRGVPLIVLVKIKKEKKRREKRGGGERKIVFTTHAQRNKMDLFCV